MRIINSIIGFEDIKPHYYITTCGKIISSTKEKVKILKTQLSNNGYERVCVYNIRGEKRRISIHRLVALAYIPNTENKPQVNHIDEVKTHNYVGNLEWMTCEENNNHGNRNKTAGESISKSRKGKCMGYKNHNSKPIEYYEKNSTQRNNFKNTCLRQGWDFNDFIEVFDVCHIKPSGKRVKKYYYIHKWTQKGREFLIDLSEDF